jgi:hypothetical protein
MIFIVSADKLRIYFAVKTTVMKKILPMILLALMAARPSMSQSTGTAENAGKLGFGIHYCFLQLSDLSTDATPQVPSNRLLVSYNPLKDLRLDFQAGYISGTSNEWTPVNADETTTAAIFGIGIHYLKTLSSCKFMAGARYYKTANSSDDFIYNLNTQQYEKFTDKESGWSFSPVLGGEYFFSRHFSLGAELCFQVGNSTIDYGDPGEVDSNSSYLKSESALNFRFYP